jgi:hypothetical protein
MARAIKSVKACNTEIRRLKKAITRVEKRKTFLKKKPKKKKAKRKAKKKK